MLLRVVCCLMVVAELFVVRCVSVVLWWLQCVVRSVLVVDWCMLVDERDVFAAS